MTHLYPYSFLLCLTAPGQVGPNPVLSAGEHSFPFEFRLPEENLPTTFEGKHGHVKYWLKAILDRPWKEDRTVVEAFTVLESVDVSQPEFLVRSRLILTKSKVK